MQSIATMISWLVRSISISLLQSPAISSKAGEGSAELRTALRNPKVLGRLGKKSVVGLEILSFRRNVTNSSTRGPGEFTVTR